MKKFILIAVLSLVLAPSTVAAPLPGTDTGRSTYSTSQEAVKQALQKVVQLQLAAFRKGDFTRAYSYASSGIRKQLPEKKFVQMVKASYPIIVSSVSIKFGPILDDGNAAIVHAMIAGAGKQSFYAYRLVRELGVWKIDGVVEAPSTQPEGMVST